MNVFWPARTQAPRWVDWLGAAFISFAGSLIAALIHSLSVYQRGIRLYQAEVGGAYFPHGGTGRPGLWENFSFLGNCAILAVPTILALLLLRKHPFYRRVVWIGCTVLWTWLFFKSEAAIH